ncbi:MAG: hypothetical protein IKM25_01885 [Clostridia bacterium]|nr:hypothetical protein [Clostridia bacterium]
MKKAKNQALETKPSENKNKIKEAVTEPEKIPSDKIRTKDGETAELDFKKVLYGYDPEEVDSYIGEMNKTYSAAVRNYESRLSSTKEELLLSNRERDSYCEKLKKFSLDCNSQAAFVEQTQKNEDSNEEYRAIIISLQEKLEKCEAEKRELSDKVKSLENEKLQHGALAQRHSLLIEQSKETAAKLEFAESQVSVQQKKIFQLEEELREKTLEVADAQARNEEISKTASDFEIKNGVLSQCLEEKENELESLKEINKTQAFEYADKINRLESEYSQSRLAMQKEMQLHEYYISRAQLTLSELNRQMEQMKQSFSDAQPI